VNRTDLQWPSARCSAATSPAAKVEALELIRAGIVPREPRARRLSSSTPLWTLHMPIRWIDDDELRLGVMLGLRKGVCSSGWCPPEMRRTLAEADSVFERASS
jgi:hypothetical protein